MTWLLALSRAMLLQTICDGVTGGVVGGGVVGGGEDGGGVVGGGVVGGTVVGGLLGGGVPPPPQLREQITFSVKPGRIQ